MHKTAHVFTFWQHETGIQSTAIFILSWPAKFMMSKFPATKVPALLDILKNTGQFYVPWVIGGKAG